MAESILVCLKEIEKNNKVMFKIDNALYKIYLRFNEPGKAYEIVKKYLHTPFIDSFVSYETILLERKKYDELVKTTSSLFFKAIAYAEKREDSLALIFYKKSKLPLWIKNRRIMEIFYKEGEYDSVIYYGERISKKDEKVREELVISYLNIGETKKAKRENSKIKNGLKRLYLEFIIAKKEKDPLKMRRAWRRIMKEYPSSAQARLVVSQLSPLTPEERFLSAQVYFYFDLKKAEKNLKELLQIKRYRKKAALKIAEIEYRRKNYEKAERIIKDMDDRAAWLIRYKIAKKKKKLKEIIFCLKKLIEREPKNPYFYLSLGTVYQESKRYKEAEEIYRKGYKKTKSRRILKRLAALLYLKRDTFSLKKLERNDVKFFYLYKLTNDFCYIDTLSESYPYSFYTIYLSKKISFDTASFEVWSRKIWKKEKIRKEILDTLSIFLRYNLLKEAEIFLNEKKPNHIECFEISKIYLKHRHPEMAIKWAERIRRDAEKRRVYYYPLELLRLLYPLSYIFSIKQRFPALSLFLSLIRQESWFNPYAKSSANALGLCQLLISTAKGLDKNITPDSLFIPETNIFLGAKYLSIQIKNFNDTLLALSSYNAGPGNVRKWKEFIPREVFFDLIPFKETENYLKKVLRGYFIYRTIYGFVD